MRATQALAFVRAVLFWELLLFLVSFFLLVIQDLLTGRINTKNLLCGTKRDGTKYFSPERVQLLVITIWVALDYLRLVMMNMHGGHLPPVPDGFVKLLSSSNGIYLAGKGLMTLKIPGLSSNGQGES